VVVVVVVVVEEGEEALCGLEAGGAPAMVPNPNAADVHSPQLVWVWQREAGSGSIVRVHELYCGAA
jgi:hypothetical protein